MSQAGKGHEWALHGAIRLTIQPGLKEKKKKIRKIIKRKWQLQSSRWEWEGCSRQRNCIMSKDTAARNCVIYSGNCKSCSRSWEDAYGRAREDKFGEVGWGWIKRTLKYFISLNLFHLKGILSWRNLEATEGFHAVQSSLNIIRKHFKGLSAQDLK